MASLDDNMSCCKWSGENKGGERQLESEGEREGVLGKVALNELTDCIV